MIPRIPSLLTAVLATALLTPAAHAAPPPNPDPSTISVWQPCEPGASGAGTGVTVVVDFNRLGAKDIQVRCAAGPQGSGIDALQNAGFAIAGTEDYGLGFICRIQGLPGSTGPEAQPCKRAAPADAYWSYWNARGGGQWKYYGVGAGGSTPKVGEIEGWSFSTEARGTIPPRVIAPGAPGPFTLPGEQPAAAPLAERTRQWIGSRPLKLSRDITPGGSDVSADAVVSWVLSGGSIAGFGQRLAAYGNGDLVARAVSHANRPLSARLYRAQPEALVDVALALIAQGIDPRRVPGSGQDLRQALLGAVQPGGEIPAAIQPDVNGGPDQLGSPNAEVQARAIELLALTGTVPASTVEALGRMSEPDGGFTDDAIDPSPTSAVLDALATAREAGTPGLDGLIDRAAASLIARQRSDGGVVTTGTANDGVAIDATLAAARAARALQMTGHPVEAARSRAYASRFQVTAGLVADHAALASADVGALLPFESALREAAFYGLTPEGTQVFVETTAARALPGLAAGTPLVLRALPPLPGAPPPVVSGDPPPATSRVPVAPVTRSVTPRLRLVTPRRLPSARALSRSGTLALSCATPRRGACRARVTVSRATARALRLRVPRGARTVLVGEGRVTARGAGIHALRVRFTRAARRALARARGRVALTVTLTGPGGTARHVLSIRR